MSYFHWIAGIILLVAWFSRVLEAAIGMPKITDVSRPEWDRKPVIESGNPRVSIIVPACDEEGMIEQTLNRLMALDYDNYSSPMPTCCLSPIPCAALSPMPKRRRPIT